MIHIHASETPAHVGCTYIVANEFAVALGVLYNDGSG